MRRSYRINKMQFSVIGVLAQKGSAGFFNPDDTIFVPLSTMQKVLAGVDCLSTLSISVGDKNMMNDVQAAVTERLAEKHRVDPENADFSIVSQADILGTLTQITTTFTLFLASIAGISLLVGGIIGILLEWLIAFAASRIANIATDVSFSSVLLAFGVSAGIDIIFGYYPARRASRLNPIEALRYE